MENYRFLKYFILLLLIITPSFTNAYSVTTHQELHKNILKEYKRLTGDKIDARLERAFIKGAIVEDRGARPINHFYDPVNNVGLKNNKRPKSVEWATNPYLQGKFGEWRLTKDKTSKLLEHKSDYTWQRAIYEYVHGDKERAMESLGHVMHLLEDITSVPHTRDDAHSGSWFDGRSYYEDYTADKTSNIKINGLIGVNDIESLFKDISTYTNTHYLSADTVFKKYDKPKFNDKKIENNYLIDKNGIKIIYVKGHDNKKTNKFEVEVMELNNSLVMQSYWDHLSFKAVESGMALMDLFFREVEKEKQTGELAYMNKSYSEVQSIANTIQGFKGVKVLLGSSLTATEAYELNKQEWEGARRAAKFYGISFPPRPIGVKKLVNKETERTLIKGQVGAAVLAIAPTRESLELESTPQPVPEPQIQKVAPSPKPTPVVAPVSKPTPIVVPTSKPVISTPSVQSPSIVQEPVPVVVTPPPVSNPSPFDPGGFAFGAGEGGGGGSSAVSSASSAPPPPPPDTTPPTIELDITGCFNQSSGVCKAYPGIELTYSWSTPDSDLDHFTIDDGATSTDSTDTSGSSTVTLASSGDTKTITLTAVDTEGNSDSKSIDITAIIPSVVINEIAWAGTENNSNDEWLELYNNEDYDIDLTGMQLEAIDSNVTIDLQGSISANSYYLIESSQEATSATADLIADFGTGLIDTGDTVRISSGSQVVDEVTPNDSGRWRYGGADTGATTHTMERFLPDGLSNNDTNWYMSSHYLVQYTNRDGDDLYGTPGSRNTINYRFTYNNQVNDTELIIDSSRSPYKFESFYIPSGKKLTITQGVHVDFLDRYKGYITVRGELITQGTQENKIIFNSTDGPAWEGIQVSSGGVLNMQYTDINKAGSRSGAYTDASIEVDDGSIVLYNVNITDSASAGLYLQNMTSTQISNSIVDDSARVGIYVNDGTVDVDSVTVSNGDDTGLYLGANVTSVSVKNSIFNNNTNIAFLNNTSNIVEFSNNSGSGNGTNGIYLDGLWLKNNDVVTLQYNSLPYVLSWLTIKDTQTLTLNEGVVIKGTPVGSSGGKSKIVIEDGGTLNLNGTDDNPIIFTTLNDPDNNPQDGDWWGIELQSGGVAQGASTTNAIIKYADVLTPAPW